MLLVIRFQAYNAPTSVSIPLRMPQRHLYTILPHSIVGLCLFVCLYACFWTTPSAWGLSWLCTHQESFLAGLRRLFVTPRINSGSAERKASASMSWLLRRPDWEVSTALRADNLGLTLWGWHGGLGEQRHQGRDQEPAVKRSLLMCEVLSQLLL